MDPALDLALALNWFYNREWGRGVSLDDLCADFSRDLELSSQCLSTVEQDGNVRYCIEPDYAAEIAVIMNDVERYMNVSVLQFLDPEGRKFSFGRLPGREAQTLAQLAVRDYLTPLTPRRLHRMFAEHL